MTTPRELTGLTDEELTFWRLIDKRERQEDGTERTILACGHSILCIVPFPEWRRYAYCAPCLHAWMRNEKLSIPDPKTAARQWIEHTIAKRRPHCEERDARELADEWNRAAERRQIPIEELIEALYQTRRTREEG